MKAWVRPSARPAETGIDGSSDPGGASGPILYCVGVFVALRIGLGLLAVIGVGLLPPLHPVSVPGWPAHAATPGWHNLWAAWERFDGLWFLRIAAHGYANGDGSSAFFPLYPMAVRGVATVFGGNYLAAALFVSNLAFLIALVLLYGLTRRELSEPAARRAVVYAAVFPTAYFFLAPYSESLFLMLVLACLWAARERRWWIAGLAGFLAALTRNVGLVLVLPLAVEALLQARAEGRSFHLIEQGGGLAGLASRAWTRLAWSAAPAAGTALYLVYWYRRSGDWLAPLHQEIRWQRSFQNPAATLWHATEDAVRYAGSYPGGYHQLDWIIVIPCLALGVYAAARFRPPFGVYTWASLLVPLCFVFAPRPLMSDPRFLLPIFPIYWALARLGLRGRLPHTLIVACSAGLLGLMTVLYVNWYYVF